MCEGQQQPTPEQLPLMPTPLRTSPRSRNSAVSATLSVGLGMGFGAQGAPRAASGIPTVPAARFTGVTEVGTARGSQTLPQRRPRAWEAEARALVENESEEILSETSVSDEEDCPLAPQLKRLRLTEGHPPPLPGAEDPMLVDFAFAASRTRAREAAQSPASSFIGSDDETCRASLTYYDGPLDGPLAVEEPATMSPSPVSPPIKEARRGFGALSSQGSDVEPTPMAVVPTSGSAAAELRRAELQRRALEEMRKYRQEVRQREGGMTVRTCPSGYY